MPYGVPQFCLPVPVSPRMSTVESVRATRSMREKSSCMRGEAVTIP